MNYYVISHTYTGPNKDAHLDSDYVEICTIPTKNGVDRTDVELRRTTDDWSVYSRGPFETFEEADDATWDLWPERHGVNVDLVKNQPLDDIRHTVATFRPGKYTALSLEDLDIGEIDANWTNDDLERIADDLEESARNLNNSTFAKVDLYGWLVSRREQERMEATTVVARPARRGADDETDPIDQAVDDIMTMLNAPWHAVASPGDVRLREPWTLNNEGDHA